MNSTTQFNVIAFVISVIVYYVIGYIWYALLFGKLWAREKGTSMGGSSFPVLPMIGQLAASVLYVLGIYMVVMLGQFGDIRGALLAGVSVIGFFVIPITSGSLLFEKKPVLFLIDAGYLSVGAIVSAIILTLWK